MVQTLLSPGVSVSIEDASVTPTTSPTSIPLIVLATRANKPLPSGTGIAPGTREANVLRTVTSPREVLTQLGNPVFVTSAGVPVHGDETNEYGLHQLWSIMSRTSRAYYIRADIDLGGLMPTADEPTAPPPDNTYWIDSDAVVGGLFRRNSTGSAWEPVKFSVYTTAPTSGDGEAGEWAFDYSTTDGVVKFKTDAGTWANLGSVDLTSEPIGGRTATHNTLYVSPAAPTGAGANDFWWKTTSASGGFNLNLRRYRASDATWVNVEVVRSETAPVPAQNVVWEDLSTFQSDGKRPLKIGTGNEFIPLVMVVDTEEPKTDPEDGTLWFDDTITDFAMYVEDGNQWVPIQTVTVSNPNNREKVISASAPTLPSLDAIWVDISGANLDRFPVVKRYNGTDWEDITDSVMIVEYDDTLHAASLVLDGTYMINLSDSRTRNTVKQYDSTWVQQQVLGKVATVQVTNGGSGYTSADVTFTGGGGSGAEAIAEIENGEIVAITITNPGVGYTSVPTVTINGDGTGAAATAALNGEAEEKSFWKPIVGSNFGRRGQRYAVVRALAETISSNDTIRSDAIHYQLITVPGYPELYDEMLTLNADKGDISFALPDVPARMIPNGIAVGKEITALDWKTNALGADSTGEFGFTGSGTPYAGFFYPWALSTNVDGNEVFVPPSTIALSTITYSDSVAYPWMAPMGDRRGIVNNASAVGYLNDDGEFVNLQLTRGQMDILYDLSINPIVFFENTGLRVWGQKTNYGVNSVLNRINVARLAIKIKKDLTDQLRTFIGEPNDPITWASARNLVERYLAGLRGLRALYDYAVRCDENTNTPDRIARNELWIEVAVQPTLTVEFVYVPIRLNDPMTPVE